MHQQVIIKPDEITNPKFIYICQTPGCGLDISEFPAAEKNPAPVKCKQCQNKETRQAIINEFKTHQEKKQKEL